MATDSVVTGTVIEHQGTVVKIEPISKPGRPRELTAEEARALTTEIQHVTVRTWLLVAEAHERKAWKALGYSSWKQYVTEELRMSEPRSFQLLDQAKIMQELTRAGMDPIAIEPPPARVVQRVKGDIKGVRRVIKKALKQGGDTDPTIVIDALRELAAANAPEKPARAPRRERVIEQVDPEPVDDANLKPPRGQRWCPVCDGTGLVTTKDAKTLAPLAVEFRSVG